MKIQIPKEELKELQRFKKLYNTEKDNQEVVDYFYKVFLYAYINGNKDVSFFVKRFNEIKEQDHEVQLSREKEFDHQSLYDAKLKKMFIHKEKIDHHDEALLFHEGMHLFHEYSSLQSQEPSKYEEMRAKALENIINNKESILEQTTLIRNKYDSFSQKATEYVYANYINKVGAKNVADYINKEKDKYQELIKKSGIYNELIEMGFNHANALLFNSKSFDHELTTYELLYTLIQQIYQDKISEGNAKLDPEAIAYEGFINAVLAGESQKELMIVYGHDKEYFQINRIFAFQEVIAHYSELKNCPDGNKWIEMLKTQLGEEFLEYMENIYTQLLTNPYQLTMEAENSIAL